MMRIAALFVVLAAVVYSQENRKKCVGIENKAGVYLARVSTNCSLYDVCNGNIHLATMECGETLVFSSTYSTCVYPDSPFNDCKKDGPTGGFYNDPRCVKQNGNNVDPDDCSKFISCTNGTLMAFQRCGDGTLYYPKNDSCEFAHAVVHECQNRRIPDTILIPDEDPLCQNIKEDVVADPTSCVHFYYCHYGRLGPRHRCPAGTAFSLKSRSCEWSAKTSCNGRRKRR